MCQKMSIQNLQTVRGICNLAGWEEFLLHCSLKAEGDHPTLIFKAECAYVLPAPL